MGKRELLLVIAFAAAGFVVYQVTAPASPSNGFSVSKLLEHARRGIQGNRASTVVSSTHTEKVDRATEEVRLALRAAELSVIGEDREDVAFDLQVTSSGFDEAEARRWANATVLKIDRAAPALVIDLKYPDEARQTAKLSIKVPSRMRVRMQPSGGRPSGRRLEIANVAAFEAANTSGTATIRNIAGAVTINHRGGELTIDRAGALRLTTRGTETKIHHITGTITAQTISGDLTATDLIGPVEIDARDTDVHLEQIKGLKAPLRVNAINGRVEIAGLRTEARIDGNDTDLEVAFDAPAPVTIYNMSQDITVTPPQAGYSLDAVATDGRITIEDGAVKATGDNTEQRATGSIRGGGAALTLRATRGDIVVRSPAGK